MPSFIVNTHQLLISIYNMLNCQTNNILALFPTLLYIIGKINQLNDLLIA